jgi:type III secretion system YscD/HrpQ family protein
MPAHLSGEGKVLNLESGNEWVIGRDHELSVFVIDDAAVSRQHALITKSDDGFFIQNLSDSKSIHVNGIEYEGGSADQVPLLEKDKIQIGSHMFTFSEGELPKQKEVKKDAYDDIFGDLPDDPPPPERNEREARKEPISQADEANDDAKPEDTLFDTVFENLESYDDIPLNLLQPTTLMLKIISGPNAGEEIGIEKGRTYTIGRAQDTLGAELPDILLHDYSVSQKHAELSVSADGVMELTDLKSKNGTHLNGQKISDKTIITPEDIISLGTTSFLIIDRDKAQHTINAAVVSYHDRDEKTEDTEITEIEEEEASVPAHYQTDDWKKKPLPIKHLIAGGSFLAVFFIVFITFFSLFKSNQVTETKKEPTVRLKESLAKYPDVQFSFNPASGKLFLVGHVGTSVDYQEMLFRISEIDFVQTTENNVVIDDLLLKSMNDIISNNSDWRGVSVQSNMAGKFELVGYVQSADQKLALSDFILVNFPYLDRLQNNVVSEDVLNTQVQSILAQDFGSVTYQISGTELTLSGNYSNKRKSEFEKLLKELNGKPGLIPGISRVRNHALPVNAMASGIDISQNYQVSGSSVHDGHGYSVILNGKIYSVGDSVDGRAITSIEPKTILLEKDGIKYKIDYKQ